MSAQMLLLWSTWYTLPGIVLCIASVLPDQVVLAAQEIVNGLQVLEVLAPSVHSELQPKV